MGTLSGWAYCPRCAGAVAPEAGRVACGRCGFVAYANSEPTACGVVVDGGNVLLVRRASAPFRGYWDLPGGFLEEGEHPLAALRRELREETGLDVEPGALIGIWTDRYGDGDDAPATLNLYWEASVLGGRLHAADDVSDARWFPADALPPPDELAFHIADVLAAWAARGEYDPAGGAAPPRKGRTSRRTNGP